MNRLLFGGSSSAMSHAMGPRLYRWPHSRLRSSGGPPRELHAHPGHGLRHRLGQVRAAHLVDTATAGLRAVLGSRRSVSVGHSMRSRNSSASWSRSSCTDRSAVTSSGSTHHRPGTRSRPGTWRRHRRLASWAQPRHSSGAGKGRERRPRRATQRRCAPLVCAASAPPTHARSRRGGLPPSGEPGRDHRATPPGSRTPSSSSTASAPVTSGEAMRPSPSTRTAIGVPFAPSATDAVQSGSRRTLESKPSASTSPASPAETTSRAGASSGPLLLPGEQVVAHGTAEAAAWVPEQHHGGAGDQVGQLTLHARRASGE